MSFDILSSTELLSNCLFIEASAGTGKTFVIEHYVIRLLLSTNFSIKKLVLITFTKAVARELRRRLSKTIKAVASMLHTGEGDLAYLQPYLLLPCEERRRHVVRLDEAAALLSQATITTIHGFCDLLLRLYSDSKGIHTECSYMSEIAKKTWIIEFLQRYSSFSSDQWRTIAKKMRYSEKLLLDEISEAIENDFSWAPLPANLLQEGRKTLQDLEISNSLCNLAGYFKGGLLKDGTLRPSLVMLTEALELYIQGDSSSVIKMFGHDFLDYFSNKKLKCRPLTDQENLLLITIREKIWPFIAEQINPDQLIGHLSSDCKTALKTFMKKTGRKTPSFVVQQARELTQDRDCQYCVGKNFSCLIVDEFQDTDAGQWEIIERLFVKNPHFISNRMLFVGDPKQAIYSFRKADVYNYLSVKELLPEESLRTLSVNHRAEREMILAQNALFCGATQPWLFYLPSLHRSLLSPEASCGKIETSSSTNQRKAIHWMVFKADLGKKRRWPHPDLEKEQIFPWIADEIAHLYFHEKVSPQDIAILVKDRYQAKDLIQFLSKKNIPATSWKVDSVFDSPVRIWLQQAFSLAASPEDRGKLSLLYHCMEENRFSQETEQIASGRLDKWAQAAYEWKRVQEAFYKRGLGGFSRTLFSLYLNGEISVRQYFLSFEDGEQYCTDLEHLLELLFRLESQLPHSLDAMQEALSSLGDHFSDDPLLTLRRIDPNKRGVSIVTMHASKGLEFPYVFALGCASRSPFFEAFKDEESDSEKLRLLYVAITRAKKRCYLPILLEQSGKPPSLGKASPIELLATSRMQQEKSINNWQKTLYEQDLLPSLENLYQSLILQNREVFSFSNYEERSPLHSFPKEEKTFATIEAFRPISVSSIQYNSFTSIKKESFHIARDHKLSINPVRFGILFHETLAKLLQENPKCLGSLESIETYLKNSGLALPSMADLLYKSFHTKLPLGDEHLCLAQIPPNQMRAECSFTDLLPNKTYQTGTIDLLIFRDDYGYIIDWKTQEIEGDCHQYAIDASYDLQAKIYRSAVQNAFMTENVKTLFIFVRHIEHGGIVCL